MARPKPEEPQQIVNFRMSPDEIERLERLAARFGLTRSQFIRNLIMTGLDETEVWEKVGVLPVAITVRDVAQWMSEKAQSLAENSSSKAEKKGKITV